MLYNNLKNSFHIISYVGCQVLEEVHGGALVKLCSAWVLQHPGKINDKMDVDRLEDWRLD